MRLSKSERLSSQALIGRLFSEGRALQVYPLRLLWIPVSEPATHALQVLIGVPRSRFRRAVDRNRIRRQIRELWRLQKNDLYRELVRRKMGLGVGLIYTGREMPDFGTLQRALSLVLVKLQHELPPLSDPLAEPGSGHPDDRIG